MKHGANIARKISKQGVENWERKENHFAQMAVILDFDINGFSFIATYTAVIRTTKVSVFQPLATKNIA